jgi:ABC-type transport system involved in multi-copper enzyme maturation permease subunit
MPAEFLKRMMRAIQSPDEAYAYPAYLATQQWFKGCNIVGIACAVLMGTGAIARERESSTLEFLMSRPIGRGRILWGKAWVMGLCVVVPIFLTSLSAIPLSWMIGRDLALGPTLHASLHASLFVLDFLALTLLLSCLIPTQVHVAFAVGGFIVAQVGLYFLQVLRAGSLFRLSDFEVYGPILAGNVSWSGPFLWMEVLMASAAIALYLTAHWTFGRRDL